MNKNPFLPGDRVVCIVNSWNTTHSDDPTKNSFPKKGEVLIVFKTWDNLLSFENHNIGDCLNWFNYEAFAPVQDATEMESEEIFEFEEMTA